MPVLPSYRNQAIYLHSKSIDWFLYEGVLWVNGNDGGEKSYEIDDNSLNFIWHQDTWNAQLVCKDSIF